MRLHTQEWGTGERLAVLVHGIMADHRTWHELVPVLTDRGYRVLAVDLRGHGASARGAYAPQLFAEDLLETLPRRPELALGHSLGALALALAVEELAPDRAVYSEPAWRLSGSQGTLDPALFTLFKRSPRLLRSFSRPPENARPAAAPPATSTTPPTDDRPRHNRPTGDRPTGDRPAADRTTDAAQLSARETARIAAERQALDSWDENSALALSSYRLVDHTPKKALVRSLVQASDPSLLVSTEMRAELVRRGFEVRTVPAAPHAIHRNHFDAFVTSLSGWL
ncbi:alpha/beta fold hydrolase [Streptomyces aurantiogriseus]|uniref:AB hydrolase-1 domain-containing protein n=1 Tax=Streptomyces aurantiogriseus TaxID=66870 RepID=A0A918FJS8_9ACTN|nr:alpha/beta hydrolase [Streptomyces aurantiogriseus]GGR43445.1 hypothetical protein GCM10010251_70620 [Streptomyces aurantiogriseus]